MFTGSPKGFGPTPKLTLQLRAAQNACTREQRMSRLSLFKRDRAKTPSQGAEYKCQLETTWSTQNHQKQRFSPPKTSFLGTKNRAFDGFGCPREHVGGFVGARFLCIKALVGHPTADMRCFLSLCALKRHLHRCGARDLN